MPRAFVRQLLVFSRTAFLKGLDVEGDWECGWHHSKDWLGEAPGPRLHKMRKEKVYGVLPSPSLFPGACISKKVPRFPLMPLRGTTTTMRAPPRWTTTSNCEPKQSLLSCFGRVLCWRKQPTSQSFLQLRMFHFIFIPKGISCGYVFLR